MRKSQRTMIKLFFFSYYVETFDLFLTM